MESMHRLHFAYIEVLPSTIVSWSPSSVVAQSTTAAGTGFLCASKHCNMGRTAIQSRFFCATTPLDERLGGADDGERTDESPAKKILASPSPPIPQAKSEAKEKLTPRSGRCQ